MQTGTFHENRYRQPRNPTPITGCLDWIFAHNPRNKRNYAVKQIIPKNQLKFYVSAIVNETFPAEPFDIDDFVAEVRSMGGDLKIVALMMGASDRSVMNWLNNKTQPHLVHRELGCFMLREVKKVYKTNSSLINATIETHNRLFPISRKPFNLQEFVWEIQDMGGSYDTASQLMRCQYITLKTWMSGKAQPSDVHTQIGVFLKSKLLNAVPQENSVAA
jgi:hypothetical protein